MGQNATLSAFVNCFEQLPVSSQMVLKDFFYEHIGRKNDKVGIRVSEPLSLLVEAEILLQLEDLRAQLPAFTRNELVDLLLAFGASGFRKNMSLDSLVSWCIDNIADDVPSICSEAVAVTVNPVYEKVKRKAYTYLKRKFDTESVADPESGETQEIPYSAIFSVAVGLDGAGHLEIAFPDDEITALLNRYKCNRCSSWQK